MAIGEADSLKLQSVGSPKPDKAALQSIASVQSVASVPGRAERGRRRDLLKQHRLGLTRVKPRRRRWRCWESLGIPVCCPFSGKTGLQGANLDDQKSVAPSSLAVSGEKPGSVSGSAQTKTAPLRPEGPKRGDLRWRCRELNPGPRNATVQVSTCVVAVFRVFVRPTWPGDGLPDGRRLVGSRPFASAGGSGTSSF